MVIETQVDTKNELQMYIMLVDVFDPLNRRREENIEVVFSDDFNIVITGLKAKYTLNGSPFVIRKLSNVPTETLLTAISKSKNTHQTKTATITNKKNNESKEQFIYNLQYVADKYKKILTVTDLRAVYNIVKKITSKIKKST